MLYLCHLLPPAHQKCFHHFWKEQQQKKKCWSVKLLSNHNEGAENSLFIVSVTSRNQSTVLLWCLRRTIINNLKPSLLQILLVGHLLKRKQKTLYFWHKSIFRLILMRTYNPLQTLNWTLFNFIFPSSWLFVLSYPFENMREDIYNLFLLIGNFYPN